MRRRRFPWHLYSSFSQPENCEIELSSLKRISSHLVRSLYPDQRAAYTFWSYFRNARNKNVGWRLDYFIISTRLQEHLCDVLHQTDVYGSDHCPIVIFLAIWIRQSINNSRNNDDNYYYYSRKVLKKHVICFFSFSNENKYFWTNRNNIQLIKIFVDD